MKRPPKQVRLDEDVEEEVKKIGEITDLPDVEIIRQIIKAGALAIKENQYKLPLPLRLRVLESPAIPHQQAPASSEKGPRQRIEEALLKRVAPKGKSGPPA